MEWSVRLDASKQIKAARKRQRNTMDRKKVREQDTVYKRL